MRIIAANFCTAIQLFRARVNASAKSGLSTIGSLLSSVVHDLKGPMAVISGYVQMMATAENEEQRQEYAKLVLKQFDSIAAMQREVLEFARGEKRVLVRKVYLGKFFEELTEELRGQLAGSKVQLTLELADRTTARFDQDKITRAVHNLARNAVEAMGARAESSPCGCFARRRAKVPPARRATSCIEVADTGPGIPKEIERQALPVVRHRRQERGHRSRAGDREEDRRGARRHHLRSTPRAGAPPSPWSCRRTTRSPDGQTSQRRRQGARLVRAVLLAFALDRAWSVASERSAAQEAELLRTGYVPLKFSVEKALDAQNLVSAELNHITEAKNPSDARNWIETERRVRPKTFAEIRAVAHTFSPVDDWRARSLSSDLVQGANEIEHFLQADGERFARLFEALGVRRLGNRRAHAKRARLVRSRRRATDPRASRHRSTARWTSWSRPRACASAGRLAS